MIVKVIAKEDDLLRITPFVTKEGFVLVAMSSVKYGKIGNYTLSTPTPTEIDNYPLREERLEGLKMSFFEIDSYSKHHYTGEFSKDVKLGTRKPHQTYTSCSKSISELKDFLKGESDSMAFIVSNIIPFFLTLDMKSEVRGIINTSYKELEPVVDDVINSYEEFNPRFEPVKFAKYTNWLMNDKYFIVDKKEEIKCRLDSLTAKILGDNAFRNFATVFRYNSGVYEFVNPVTLGRTIRNTHKNMNSGDILNYADVKELEFQFACDVDDILKHKLHVNKSQDLTRIPLSFLNGTLYVTENGYEFIEKFNPEDMNYIKFNIDFTDEIMTSENGMFNDWVNHRFPNPHATKMFKMLLGDLVSTTVDTQVHGFIWGKGGIGKSSFSALLSSIFTEASVSEISFSEITHKFGKLKLLETPIIITDEASEKSMESTEYKRAISREPSNFEAKHIQNFQGQYLSKILTFGNNSIKIAIDSGVTRRLIMIEANSDKFMTDVSPSLFGDMLGSRRVELVKFIIEGVQTCITEKYDLKDYYYNNLEEEKTKVIVNNEVAGVMINKYFSEEASPIDEELLTTDMVYDLYIKFLCTTDGVRSNQMTKLGLSKKLAQLNFDKHRKKINNKRVLVYKNLVFNDFGKALYQMGDVKIGEKKLDIFNDYIEIEAPSVFGRKVNE